MSRNKKPRKAYVPKPCLINPMTNAVSHDDQRTLKLVPHAELTKLQFGKGDSFSWEAIAQRLNFGMVLATLHDFGMDLVPIIEGGQFCIIDIKNRFERTGQWGINGTELTALGNGLNITDEMQDATTRRQHREALLHVLKNATV